MAYTSNDYKVRVWSKETEETKEASLKEILDKEEDIQEMAQDSRSTGSEGDREGFIFELTETPTDEQVVVEFNGQQMDSLVENHDADFGRQILEMAFYQFGEDAFDSVEHN